MTPQQKDRIEKILDLFTEGVISPDDLVKAIDSVVGLIKQSQDTVLSKVDTNDKATEKKIKELETAVDRAVTNLVKYSEKLDSDKASSADVEKLRVQIGKEINRVAALIPQIPDEFDASEIYETIEGHKKLLENISILIVGENIRNALEALPDGEKLAIDAVEGLREELSKRVEAARSTTAIVAHNLYQISDVDLTGLSNGDTIIWNSTTNRWEAGAGGTGGGHTIQDEGTPLTQRTNLNFVGAGVTVTDDAGNDATVVTINGGAGHDLSLIHI
jgi:hypothetical protein